MMNHFFSLVTGNSSPVSPRSLKDIELYDNLPISASKTSTEPGVCYFHYSLEHQDTTMSLDTRLTKLFCELRATPSQDRPFFKITFDIEAVPPCHFAFSDQLRQLFYSSLPHIEFIEITGSQGLVFLHSLFGVKSDAFLSYGPLLLKSSIRLSLKTPLNRRTLNLLKELLVNILKVNPAIAREISLENQLFSQECWEEIMQSLSQVRPEITLSLTHCFLEDYVTNENNDHIPQTRMMTSPTVLALLIKLLPPQINQLKICDKTFDISRLVRNIDFYRACSFYKEKFGQPLKLSLSQKAFRTLQIAHLEHLFSLLDENVLDLGNIFAQIPQALLIDYLWLTSFPQSYGDVLSLMEPCSALEITTLPRQISDLGALISALPAHVTTLIFKTGALDLSQLLSSEVVAALKNFQGQRLLWLDLSATPITISHEATITQMTELLSCNIGFKGLRDEKISSHLVSRAILRDSKSLESWLPMIKQELYRAITPKNLQAYYHPKTAKALAYISKISHLFLSAQNGFLFEALGGKDDRSPLGEALSRLYQGQNDGLDWERPACYRTQLALYLWRYALKKHECPLSLQPCYVERMLSEADHPLDPAPRYGLFKVSFAALPQLVIDSLSSEDKTAIKKLLESWFTKLQQAHRELDLLRPFLICESHDPTELIWSQECLRKSPEPLLSTASQPLRHPEKKEKSQPRLNPRIYY